MELVILLTRTLFFYFLTMLVMFLLLKKKKTSLADLLIAFMIAQLSIVGINQPGKPLITILLPIVLFFLLHRIFGPVFRKEDLKGKESKKEPDLMSDQPLFKWPAADVEMAAMDPIVIQYPIGPLPLLLILDGNVMDDNLDQIGQTRFWLKNEVQRFGVRRFREVSYCSMDRNGQIFLDKKKS